MIKKIIFLLLILTFFILCFPRQEKVEKKIEGGVEVIFNHIEPYKLKGEPSMLILEKEFVIDLEKSDIAKTGIADVTTFGVDSSGNIYILSIGSKENLIYKFDKKGKFITSFIRKGQGPGEFQFLSSFQIDSQDRILITDPMNHKFLILSNDGNLIKEIPLGSNIWAVTPLDNGNKLIRKRIIKSINNGFYQWLLILCNPQFEEIKTLYVKKSPMFNIATRINGLNTLFIWRVSKGKIYIGSGQKGYEILVYDMNGNLIRKIKKKYKQIKVTEEFKRIFMSRFGPMPENVKKKFYFPAYMPSFYSFFADDEGRIFFMTYEKGKKPGEYVYDILNSDGIFIARKPLNIYWVGPLLGKAINGRIYCVQEKKSGYKELVVYRTKWK